MNLKSKAKLLLGIFVISGLLTQTTRFMAEGDTKALGDTCSTQEDAGAAAHEGETADSQSVRGIYEQLKQASVANRWILLRRVHWECERRFMQDVNDECKRRLGVDDDTYAQLEKESERYSCRLSWDGEYRNNRGFIAPEEVRLYMRCHERVERDLSESSTSLLRNQRDENGNTFLHLVAGDADCDMELLSCISDLWGEIAMLKSQNRNGDTPLHVAVRSGNIEMVRFILGEICPSNVAPATYDTRVNEFLGIKNAQGLTALKLAEEFRNSRIVDAINHSNAEKTEPLYISEYDSKSGEEVKKLTFYGTVIMGLNRYERIVNLFESVPEIKKITNVYPVSLVMGRQPSVDEENRLIELVNADNFNVLVDTNDIQGGSSNALMRWAWYFGLDRLCAHLEKLGAPPVPYKLSIHR